MESQPIDVSQADFEADQEGCFARALAANEPLRVTRADGTSFIAMSEQMLGGYDSTIAILSDPAYAQELLDSVRSFDEPRQLADGNGRRC